MANVNLVNYVIVDTNEGQSAANPPTISDVFMPNDRHVSVGLTCFFGFKSTMEDLSKVRMNLDKPGIEVYTIEISTEIDKPIPMTMDVKHLSNFPAINLDRVSTTVENMILGYFRDFLTSNMSREDAIMITPDIRTAITAHPELLADLHDMPEFSHMNVFIYTLGDPDNRSTRATLFNYDNLSYASYKNAPDDMPVYLPELEGVAGYDAIRRLRKETAKAKNG